MLCAFIRFHCKHKHYSSSKINQNEFFLCDEMGFWHGVARGIMEMRRIVLYRSEHHTKIDVENVAKVSQH